MSTRAELPDRPPPLARLLLGAHRWFDEGLQGLLEDAGYPGIPRSHSMVFAHLGRHGERESALARRIGVTRQSVHQTVHELREMGLVELVEDPTNRSAKLVRPSSRGRASIRAALRAFADLERELGRRIGPRHVRELRRALEMDWGPPVGRGEDA